MVKTADQRISESVGRISAYQQISAEEQGRADEGRKDEGRIDRRNNGIVE